VSFLDNIPDVILTGPVEAPTHYGKFLRIGDVNGNGYGDLLVGGASRWNHNQGRVYLYFGQEGLMDDIPDMIFTGETAENFFGEGVGIGDVNGDGHLDLIIGAPGYSQTQGRVYMYHGGPSIDVVADVIIDGEPDTSGAFGAVLIAGDVNNDGCADVLIDAMRFNNNTGRAYLFYGGKSMDTTADLVFDGEKEGDRFGRDIDNPKTIGDVNGDGYGDLLISSRYWNYAGGANGQGRSCLYYGGPGKTMDAIPDKVFTGENWRDDFGVSACVFDIDHDGFEDVIIGARSYNNFRGRVYLFWGGEDMDTVPDVVFEAELDPLSNFGCGVHAGYVDDDEYGDIIVAAPYYNSRPWTGKGYLFFGDTKARINTVCDRIFTLPWDTTNFPQRAALGDLNNDNLVELAIAGPYYSNYQGRVWLYYNRPPVSADELARSLPEAAASGDLDRVKSLLSKGINVNVREWGSLKTCLHYAAANGDWEVAKLLLTCGAQVNARDAVGATPLHYAVERSHEEIAKLLIAKGADIHALTRDGTTPLDEAVWDGNTEIVDFLIANGADVNGRINQAQAPLDIAINQKREDMKKLLLSKGAHTSSLRQAVLAGDFGQVKACLEGSPDVNGNYSSGSAAINGRDGQGMTLLHLAAQGGHKEVVGLLISEGMDVNAKSTGGRTPLDLALDQNGKDIVELLRKHGAKE
jgi:ankyrin repeat protein